MQFQAFAKPFFDRGKAWSFKATSVIFMLINRKTAWFDELLDSNENL
jgi:hypothetical protein